MLFVLRLFSAIAIYICLTLTAKYSLFASLILVGGYRSFLVFSPYVIRYLQEHSLVVLFGLAIIGIILYSCLELYIFGALFIAFGLSVSGFVIKAIAAETPATSGLNKIAITAGNIGAGTILFLSTNNDYLSFGIAALLLIMCCFMPMPTIKTLQNTTITSNILRQNKYVYFIWFLFGVTIGVRVFGMYVVMPKYLIKTLGSLPAWYGTTLVFYGIIVIFTQFHAISKKFIISLPIAVLALSGSCVVMSVPGIFKIETVFGALLWCLCLAVEEIFAPYIDFYAAQTNTLLVKEFSISLGGALSVLLTNNEAQFEYLGIISIGCACLGYILYLNTLKKQTC